MDLQQDEVLPAQKRKRAEGSQKQSQKRQQWEAKQAKEKQQHDRELARTQWIKDNSGFAWWVSEEDADFSCTQNTNSSPLHQLLLPYKNIQDTSKRGSARDNESHEQLFIAEGTETIRLLIQQSIQQRPDGVEPLSLKSIFVKPSILFEEPVNLLRDIQHVKEQRGDACPGFHVLVGPEAALSMIAGFTVSRGAMACGVVPNDCDEAWLERVVGQRMSEEGSKKLRLLALDGICDTANLGSMIRCASAFGVDAVVLSKDCCDAWYRRAVRVSMGHVFKVPVVRVGNLAKLLQSWKARYPALHSFAAVIDTESLLSEYGVVNSTWCCVLGNEGSGISKPVADACTQRIRIDIEHGVDSLSVPIACGILLHGLREREVSRLEADKK
jgi:tRNA G18 (ribose-2'-O)-methylase SpoU